MSTRSSSARPLRQLIGVVLLVLASVALLDRFTALKLLVAAPVLIGAALLAWALLARQVKVLVPACILLGLGAGLVAEQLLSAGPAVDRAAFFLCFATGFALIPLLAQGVFRQRQRWPLVPALILAILGLLHLGGVDLRQAGRLSSQLWPFAAIGVAAWLIFARPRRR